MIAQLTLLANKRDIASQSLLLVGMWRNVTPVVNAVAAANNYLLPAWMIGFGVWLIVSSRRAGRGEA